MPVDVERAPLRPIRGGQRTPRRKPVGIIDNVVPLSARACGKTSNPPAPRGVALMKPCGTRTGAQNQFISNYQPYHPNRITSPSKHRSGMHYYISGTLSLVPGTLYLSYGSISASYSMVPAPLHSRWKTHISTKHEQNRKRQYIQESIIAINTRIVMSYFKPMQNLITVTFRCPSSPC